tara:strand:- start:405 stop:653 length:249 start_codon:yes stop_codon:yes gene_type:complete
MKLRISVEKKGRENPLNLPKYRKKAKMEFQHDFLDNLANHQYQKLLREVTNDDKIPKKTDKVDKTLIDISKDTTILDVNLYD